MILYECINWTNFLEVGLNICFSDNFQDQMKRELSYREEMVQQLHIVRGETHQAEEALDSNTYSMYLPNWCSVRYFEA